MKFKIIVGQRTEAEFFWSEQLKSFSVRVYPTDEKGDEITTIVVGGEEVSVTLLEVGTTLREIETVARLERCLEKYTGIPADVLDYLLTIEKRETRRKKDCGGRLIGYYFVCVILFYLLAYFFVPAPPVK